MSLLVIPDSKEEIRKCYSLVDGYILSVEELSVNVNFKFKKQDLYEEVKFLKSNNKKVYVSLNRNVPNKRIPILKEVMSELDDLNIDGVLFYDVSIVQAKFDHKFSYDLVWNQEHLATNYLTSDFWYDNGAKYTMLSYELTKDEMVEICEKSKAHMMAPVFGHQPVFTSIRKLLTFYKETFEVIDTSNVCYLYKEGKSFPLFEDEENFMIYSSNVFNGFSLMNELNADYFVFNSMFVHIDDVYEILKNLKEKGIDNTSEFINETMNSDDGFLNKKTIYKVKKDEK